MNWRELVGLNVLRLRVRLGITQVELSQRLKISQPRLSNIENGVGSVNADELPTFARVLGAKVEEFFYNPVKPEGPMA